MQCVHCDRVAVRFALEMVCSLSMLSRHLNSNTNYTTEYHLVSAPSGLKHPPVLIYEQWHLVMFFQHGPIDCQISKLRCLKSKNLNVSHLILQASLRNLLKPGVSRKWRCSWSSADRRCSNYIRVINNFSAQQGATYIRGLMVYLDNGIAM